MFDRLQRKLLRRYKHLAEHIDGLEVRCDALERGVAQFNGALPSKLQVDTATLINEIRALQREMDSDHAQRSVRDEGTLTRADRLLSGVDNKYAQEEEKLQEGYMKLLEFSNSLAKPNSASDDEAQPRDSFKAFIIHEINSLKMTLDDNMRVRQ